MKIALFVSGSIAAFKIPTLVSSLIKNGHEVRVAMTSSAKYFVTEKSLAIMSKHPVLTDENQFQNAEHVSHIELAQWAELALIAPASANTIAKLANGIADNVVTTTLLATNAPKIVIPAMNNQMWSSQQTQENISRLRKFNINVIEPEVGMLAEGYEAKGKMPEPSTISLIVENFDSSQFLKGKKILISAGGTKERLDPVRFLTNDSSGKMGTALANAAAGAGALVTLVTTKDLPTIPNVKKIFVESAQELNNKILENFSNTDIVIMAAAVSDYRVDHVANQKIKKTSPTAGLDLHLIQNPDILSELGQKKENQYVVGFAAETNDLVANATKKLEAKKADMIIANSVGGENKGFNSEDNEITILRHNQEPKVVSKMAKTQIAKIILKELL
ncbi:bifunctional phosphopantothenoylcysteine decarboxylase/phosphopantothenate--cysteine ligase CoaBC [Companilactobacillus sp. DQM5]|uniref:bifunctional phosphopantothenoylcysteine decarboxylase/phosphopantothenate--cysteine ligase CoaBC n=1 Tax=Companilactobacillus sp. DQM5 TaxID=3463359 RepID=UPI004058ED3D